MHGPIPPTSRRLPMRFLLATLLAAAAVSAAAPAAKAGMPYDPYAWCAEYGGGRGGATNCYFLTWQQCMWALSGNGGYCRRNTFYTGPGGYYDEYTRHQRYRYRAS